MATTRLFQSLSGSKRSFYFGARQPGECGPKSFNPFQGVRGLSTGAPTTSGSNPNKFQSLSGSKRSFYLPGRNYTERDLGFNPFQGVRGLSTVSLICQFQRSLSFNPFQGVRGLSTLTRNVQPTEQMESVSIPFRE